MEIFGFVQTRGLLADGIIEWMKEKNEGLNPNKPVQLQVICNYRKKKTNKS